MTERILERFPVKGSDAVHYLLEFYKIPNRTRNQQAKQLMTAVGGAVVGVSLSLALLAPILIQIAAPSSYGGRCRPFSNFAAVPSVLCLDDAVLG